MNQGLNQLTPYPFAKLGELLGGVATPEVDFSVGEPKHTPAPFLLDELTASAGKINQYPSIKGTTKLRQTISQWLQNRYPAIQTIFDPDRHVLPVNGTREGLFAVAQCLINGQGHDVALMPNPFYQIYEGATLLAGGKPWYINASKENDYLPDLTSIPKSILNHTRLMYVCSPNNPTGKIYPTCYWQEVLTLSEKYGFTVVSDECYSEIYSDEKPVGLLEVASAYQKNDEFKNCLIFNSLSKRSNLAGLRSGFVAGDPKLIDVFYRYRSYHGVSMSPILQETSVVAWKDEKHVAENRSLYKKKIEKVFDLTRQYTEVDKPEGGFYLWLKISHSDIQVTKTLYENESILVLPGSFLSRDHQGVSPGENYIRIALVPPLETCITSMKKLLQHFQQSQYLLKRNFK